MMCPMIMKTKDKQNAQQNSMANVFIIVYNRHYAEGECTIQLIVRYLIKPVGTYVVIKHGIAGIHTGKKVDVFTRV